MEMGTNGMLSEAAKKVIELMAEKELLTKQEVNSFLQQNGFDPKDVSIDQLNEEGYMKVVEGMGTVLIATKKCREFLKN